MYIFMLLLKASEIDDYNMFITAVIFCIDDLYVLTSKKVPTFDDSKKGEKSFCVLPFFKIQK